MKRRTINSILLILIVLFLVACMKQDDLKETNGTGTKSVSEHRPVIFQTGENNVKYQEITLSGQAGIISIQIPEGWESVSFPGTEDKGSYRIRFYPEKVEKGYIELAYMNSFGVCGTGLVEEEIIIAGDTANMGTYDKNEYWAYIVYEGKNKGLFANTFYVDEWWDEYSKQVMEILSTASIDIEGQSETEDMYYDDTRVGDIGLSMIINNISRTGADLSFIQYDGNPRGDLEYGDDFIIEKNEKGEWKEATIVLEGVYGYNAIAYHITKDGVTDFEIDWEWLYGELESGEYRIGKGVIDFLETGSYDKYMIYAHFVIN